MTKFFGLIFLMSWPVGSMAQTNIMRYADSLLGAGISFLPIPILYNSPETSWGAGLSTGYYFRQGKGKERNSNVQAQMVYTLRKQFISRLSADVFGPEENWYAYGYLSYRSYADRFYGIGPEAQLAERLDFSFRSWEAWGGWLWKLGDFHFLGPQIRHQYVYRLQPNDPFAWNMQALIGGNGYQTTGLGLEYRYDSRNNVQSAQKGWFTQLFGRLHPHWHGSAAFGTVGVDVRHYASIMANNVWANRLLLQQQSGDPPFRELSMAGGSDFARGYFEGRYRDKSLAGLESEWRWHAHRYLGINAFASVFGVAGTLQQIPQTQLKGSYGLGLRVFVNPEERIALRIDVARNTEGQYGFYIDLSEAF